MDGLEAQLAIKDAGLKPLPFHPFVEALSDSELLDVRCEVVSGHFYHFLAEVSGEVGALLRL